jgi:hypothetical protein
VFLGLPVLGVIVQRLVNVTPARFENQPRRSYPESLFSEWDGSHAALVNHVKSRMNDPDSFEHDETKFIDQGNYLFVTMKYRGTNAFGGVVTNYVNAKVDRQGNIIDNRQCQALRT